MLAINTGSYYYRWSFTQVWLIDVKDYRSVLNGYLLLAGHCWYIWVVFIETLLLRAVRQLEQYIVNIGTTILSQMIPNFSPQNCTRLYCKLQTFKNCTTLFIGVVISHSLASIYKVGYFLLIEYWHLFTHICTHGRQFGVIRYVMLLMNLTIKFWNQIRVMFCVLVHAQFADNIRYIRYYEMNCHQSRTGKSWDR